MFIVKFQTDRSYVILRQSYSDSCVVSYQTYSKDKRPHSFFEIAYKPKIFSIQHYRRFNQQATLNLINFIQCIRPWQASSLSATREIPASYVRPPVLFASTGLCPELYFFILQSPSLVGPLERHLAI